MPDITITTRRGAVLALSAHNGRTLMEVLREHGEVEAACGGQCVCATCHVHVDAAWMDVVGAPAVSRSISSTAAWNARRIHASAARSP